MGINLNKAGGLTVSQTIQADSLGISHDRYKQYILDRLIGLRGGETPRTVRSEKMKRTTITATNPVLIVAGGPSYKENIEQIRNFPGKIVIVDVNFNYVLSKGVIPDYVITLESTQAIVNTGLYKSEYLKLCRDKTKIVGSSITRDKIKRHIKEHGIPFERWIFEEEPRCSNVGNYAINFAKNKLDADKICIIGFEHNGTTYPKSTYLVWQTDFWYFLRKWPKETIVNCSDGGALYYEDYVIDSSLDKLKII